MRILFFTENLYYGGKERRLLELILYLRSNTNYTIALVITEPEIHFSYVHDLGIPIKIIRRKVLRFDPLLFISFYKYCRRFKPDIIHTWGKMTTFYAIPTKLALRVSLISNLIADAQRNYKSLSLDNFFYKSDVFFADAILSNSLAGLKAYRITSHKAKVILNGVNLDRFMQKFDIESIRKEYGFNTPLIIVMVASFTRFKDYDLFLDVAKEVGKTRSDTSFVAVGDGSEWNRIKKRITDEQINNVILTGPQNAVERIIAVSDIGLLTTYSEGISNSIIEYMALGKPVIVSDLIGGSSEIVLTGETGFCTARSISAIVPLVNRLLDNENIRFKLGAAGKQRIISTFSIEKMSKAFMEIYEKTVS